MTLPKLLTATSKTFLDANEFIFSDLGKISDIYSEYLLLCSLKCHLSFSVHIDLTLLWNRLMFLIGNYIISTVINILIININICII